VHGEFVLTEDHERIVKALESELAVMKQREQNAIRHLANVNGEKATLREQLEHQQKTS
jgi:predicted  nucleic acid-binding Zn-ribbon protein